jgi:hypothetical protein
MEQAHSVLKRGCELGRLGIWLVRFASDKKGAPDEKKFLMGKRIPMRMGSLVKSDFEGGYCCCLRGVTISYWSHARRKI